jgi:hypothetical protein
MSMPVLRRRCIMQEFRKDSAGETPRQGLAFAVSSAGELYAAISLVC